MSSAGAKLFAPAPARLHFFVLALNRVIGWTAARGFLLRRTVVRTRCSTLTVDFRRNLVEALLQRLACRFDARHIIGAKRRANIGDLRFQLALLIRSKLVTQIGDTLLRPVGRAISQIALLNLFFAPPIFGRMRFGVAHLSLNLILREAAGGHNGDLLLAPGAFVFRRDIQNAVCVDIECYFDLRNATGSRWNTIQDKGAQRAVIFGKLALALQHIDLHARLVIAGGRKDLALLRWNGCIAVNQAREDAAQSFDAQRERSHIEQENILHITGQYAGLNGGSYGHHFVRIHPSVRLAVEDAFDQRLHRWHTGLTTYQHNLVDIAGTNTCVGKGSHHRLAGFLNQLLNQLL